jgi:hypothetical protein
MVTGKKVKLLLLVWFPLATLVLKKIPVNRINMRGIIKGQFIIFFILQKVHKNKYTFVTPVHGLPDTICKECFHLCVKPHIQCAHL